MEGKRLEISIRTFNDTKEKLEKFGRCNVIRPVGFGKTYMLTELATNGGYKKVYYFYPREIIRSQVEIDYWDKIQKSHSNIKFYTYAKLSRSAGLVEESDWLQGLNGSLFIFDESHFIGGEKVSQAFLELYEKYKGKCHFLGASANRIRDLGKTDVSAEYFGGIEPFYYDFNMALEDGIYPTPNYIFNVFDEVNTPEDLRLGLQSQKYYQRASENEKRDLMEYLNRNILKQTRYLNQSSCFKHIFEKYLTKEQLSYMKIFAYFSNTKLLDSQSKSMVDAMKVAFPDKKINLIKVSSREGENDTSRVTLLERKEGEIDIVASVDMLSYGYHIDDITAVVMYRSTDSDIIFEQQSHRGISITNKNSALIIDMVGNYSKAENRKFMGMSKATPVGIGNTGGVGMVNPKNINLISFQANVKNLYGRMELDRLYKMKKLINQVELGRMPIEIACREMGFTKVESFYNYKEAYKDIIDSLNM